MKFNRFKEGLARDLGLNLLSVLFSKICMSTYSVQLHYTTVLKLQITRLESQSPTSCLKIIIQILIKTQKIKSRKKQKRIEKKQIILFEKKYIKSRTLKKLKNPDKSGKVFSTILQFEKLKNFENPKKSLIQIKKCGQKTGNIF